MTMRSGLSELLRQLARHGANPRTLSLESAIAGAAPLQPGSFTWPPAVPPSSHSITQASSNSALWNHGLSCSCYACTRHDATCSCLACAKQVAGGAQHAATCSCPACSKQAAGGLRHAATCSCPACSKQVAGSVSHAATCSCLVCHNKVARGTKHAATCGCPACTSMHAASYHHSRGMYSSYTGSLPRVRHMACSAGLGRAPPQQVVIEYDPDDVDAYIEVADALEAAFPNIVVLGNEQEGGRKGSFEVTTSDGFQVFSKLKEHQYPKLDDLVARITNRAALNPEVLGSSEDGGGRFCT